MAKVTVILGLCGSGKTHLSEEISSRTGAKIYEGVCHHNSLSEIIKSLNDGQDCILEEIAFSTDHGRKKLLNLLRIHVQNFTVEWFCFENDLASANWNVRKRTNKDNITDHLSINEHLASIYTYPEGITPIPIQRINT